MSLMYTLKFKGRGLRPPTYSGFYNQTTISEEWYCMKAPTVTV